MRTRKLIATAALSAFAALSLAACASEDSEAINIAVFNGWDEGIATSELWKAVLEEQGYEVNLAYADVAPVFEGLSQGDYDFTTDVWLPGTHAEYLENYGDKIDHLGAWNADSALTIAVNEDAPITSLAELAEAGADFDYRIVGIEPGAGLTLATENSVIPTYGLEDFEFITSSTAAMLSELQAATEAGENIVVTLWEPHWAYGAFPVRNLEDPEGALGGTETINTYARLGFADDQPEVAEWLANFDMSLELLYDLENLLFVENDTDDLQPLVKQWMEDNRDWVDSLTS